MLKIKTFVFSDFYENTYLAIEPESKEAVVIDPGCLLDEEKKEIYSFIIDNQLKIVKILNTHCHLDHIFGVEYLKSKFNVEYLYHKEDDFLIDIQIDYSKKYGIELKKTIKADKFLNEGDFIKIGKDSLKVIHTPGHSPGGVCFYSQTSNFCITGDTIFQESIGRTDLWNGDYFTLIESINSKILTLPENTELYPGHGNKTTVIYEKNNNQFL